MADGSTAASADDGILTRELVRFFDRMSAHFPGHVMQRVLEPDGRVHYTYVSPGLTALGLDRDAIMSDADSRQDWIHPDDAGRWRVALKTSAETLDTLDEEVRVIGRDGRVRWVRSIGNPRRLPSGAVVWDGIALDETDKREALDAMRLAKAQADAAEAAKARLIAAVTDRLARMRAGLGRREGEARHGLAADLDATLATLREGLGDDADAADAPRVDPRIAALTPRRRAVLDLLAEGCSNREIARALDIAEGTVKLHVVAVLKAIGATNRTEAALIARAARQ